MVRYLGRGKFGEKQRVRKKWSLWWLVAVEIKVGEI